jgi:hypothetical protein
VSAPTVLELRDGRVVADTRTAGTAAERQGVAR